MMALLVSPCGVRIGLESSRACGGVWEPPGRPQKGLGVGEAALTREGSALSRHDVFDKGWEGRQKSVTTLGPSQPLTSKLPTTLSTGGDSFSPLGLMGEKQEEETQPLLCVFPPDTGQRRKELHFLC